MDMFKGTKLLIWIFSALLVIMIFVIIFFPNDTENITEPPKKINARFLSMDSHWADSVVDGMDLDHMIKTLIMYKIPEKIENDSLLNIGKNGYGGLFFSYPAWDNLAFMDSSDQRDSFPLIKAVSLTSMISELPDTAFTHVMYSGPESNLKFYAEFMKEVREKFGVNCIRINLPELYKKDSLNQQFILADRKYSLDKLPVGLMDSLLSDSTLLALDMSISEQDSLFSDSITHWYEKYFNMGLTGLFLKGKSHQNLLKKTEFGGLLFAEVDSSNTEEFLKGGCELFITSEPEKVYQVLKKLVLREVVKEKDLVRSVKRVLMAGKWSEKKRGSKHSDKSMRYFLVRGEQFRRQFVREGITVVKNDDKILPLVNIPKNVYVLRVGEPVPGLAKGIGHYANIFSTGVNHSAYHDKVSWLTLSKYNPVVIALNEPDSLLDTIFLNKLTELDKKTNLILINGKNRNNLHLFDEFESVVQLKIGTEEEWNRAGQMICGGIRSAGQLTMSLSDKLKSGQGNQTQKTRLAYTEPEEVGMDRKALSNINHIVYEGIANRAFPGCQVLAVKNGEVVYHQSFGYLTYARQIPVTNNHLYDMASITKIVATTVIAMKLYDLGKYKLYDSLYMYLPDTLNKHLKTRRSTLRYLTWQQILTHSTGLPPGFPYTKYIQYMDSLTGRYDKFYCDASDDSSYCIPIAQDYYMDRIYQDSIWIKINELDLTPGNHYVYSDVNFILLYKLFKGMLERDRELVAKKRWEKAIEFNAFERYLNEQFYQPLRMNYTTYQPLRYFSKNWIAPTEEDKYWRMQVVHGYVHDPTAALLGGISGNAGVFSNAHDMAIIFQVLMNKGVYGGVRYINATTVDKFTSGQPGTHRGLGFNKPTGGGMYGIPEEVSINAFGHTGFTGNFIWADPVNDIIYIFISNRSHPEPHNPKIFSLKTNNRIHQTVYKSIVDEEWKNHKESLDSLSLIQ